MTLCPNGHTGPDVIVSGFNLLCGQCREGLISGPEVPENADNRRFSELYLLPTPENAENRLGRMQTAVETDLTRMTDLDKGVRGSLAALARELARAMDATGDDQPTPAQTGQLGQQLRTTLLALAEATGDSTAAEAFFRLMSTAVQSASGDANDNPPRDADRVRRPRAVPVSGVQDGEGEPRSEPEE